VLAILDDDRALDESWCVVALGKEVEESEPGPGHRTRVAYACLVQPGDAGFAPFSCWKVDVGS
jgi:hypothetical protein